MFEVLDPVAFAFTVFGGLYAVFQLVITWLFINGLTSPKPHSRKHAAVLVAARNEEAQILTCLQSLAAQSYPAERLKIFIGDDNSDDRTGELTRKFIAGRTNFHYLKITESINGLRGKQNVLAHLARQVPDAEVLLFTDADIRHDRLWASLLLTAFNDPAVGVVSGPTIVQPRGAWASLQALDWAVGVATIKAFDRVGLPITSVGNNMGVSRQAYDAVGGYEALPFSITEDFLLFKAVLDKGYQARWLFNRWVTNLSSPIATFGGLLQQRRRWFQGGKKGPWYALAAFGFHAASVGVGLLGFALLPLPLAASLWALKWLVDFILTAQVAITSGRLRMLVWYPLYIPYHTVLVFVLLPLLALPGPIIWKGRSY
jgi:cellulose synthase/poly-beta-1,6-N-acetylglucosamine synthase-like glycosyltransferase